MMSAINKIIKMMSDLSKPVDIGSGSGGGGASGRATTLFMNPVAKAVSILQASIYKSVKTCLFLK